MTDAHQDQQLTWASRLPITVRFIARKEEELCGLRADPGVPCTPLPDRRKGVPGACVDERVFEQTSVEGFLPEVLRAGYIPESLSVTPYIDDKSKTALKRGFAKLCWIVELRLVDSASCKALTAEDFATYHQRMDRVGAMCRDAFWQAGVYEGRTPRRVVDRMAVILDNCVRRYGRDGSILGERAHDKYGRQKGPFMPRRPDHVLGLNAEGRVRVAPWTDPSKKNG